MTAERIVAIALGDPSGVGPEIAMKTARDRRQIYRWLDAFDLRGVRDEE